MYKFNLISNVCDNGFKYDNRYKIESLSLSEDFKRDKIGQPLLNDVNLCYNIQ